MKRFIAIILLSDFLGGCAGQMPTSILGGECKLDPDPGFALRGKRIKDSRYIGTLQEKHIQVCGWKRPTI